jgi:hypothetical protein
MPVLDLWNWRWLGVRYTPRPEERLRATLSRSTTSAPDQFFRSPSRTISARARLRVESPQCNSRERAGKKRQKKGEPKLGSRLAGPRQGLPVIYVGISRLDCGESTDYKLKRWTLCLPTDLSVPERQWFESWRDAGEQLRLSVGMGTEAMRVLRQYPVTRDHGQAADAQTGLTQRTHIPLECAQLLEDSGISTEQH